VPVMGGGGGVVSILCQRDRFDNAVFFIILKQYRLLMVTVLVAGATRLKAITSSARHRATSIQYRSDNFSPYF
jgi:hypothetical protein